MRHESKGLTFLQAAIYFRFQRYARTVKRVHAHASGRFPISMPLIRRLYKLNKQQAWNQVRELREENLLEIVAPRRLN